MLNCARIIRGESFGLPRNVIYGEGAQSPGAREIGVWERGRNNKSQRVSERRLCFECEENSYIYGEEAA